VYAPSLVRTIAEVLAQLGARRAFVVHGAGGIDELSPSGPNLVCEVVDGGVREREVDPLELGLPRCDPGELRGGSPAENAAAIRAVFRGENGVRGSSSRARPSTRAPLRLGSTRWSSSRRRQRSASDGSSP
jgi:anthranilate phosphoribosyltransferase